MIIDSVIEKRHHFPYDTFQNAIADVQTVWPVLFCEVI
jgi:hypothetical protein